MSIKKRFTRWAGAASAAMGLTALHGAAANVYAQEVVTATVPFVVNVDATVTITPPDHLTNAIDVTADMVADTDTTLTIVLSGWTTSARHTARARGAAPAMVNYSRGNVSLKLSPQQYGKADISLFSVNGRRVLSGKADAARAGLKLSRGNVAAGVYLLSVRGTQGNTYSNRLIHNGGRLNIDVAFDASGIAPRLAKASAQEDYGVWNVVVSASAPDYADSAYTFEPVAGDNARHTITLRSATFTDARDNKTYKWVKIGNQTWMAENLNYDTANSVGSWCYGNAPDNCAKYGRLYTWATVMAGDSSSSYNPSGVQGICPSDWHVPSDAEWDVLIRSIDSSHTSGIHITAGGKLKSKTGWDANYGTDEYGFSALPGGYGLGSSFGNVGSNGGWWSATESDAGFAWGRDMSYYGEYVGRSFYGKSYLFSLRCVRDVPTTHTITFDANYTGGTVTPATATTETDGKLASLPTPTRSGYTFSGWFTAATGGTAVNTSTAFRQNTTVYAQWTLIDTEMETGSFTDTRDGKTYKWVTIGTQTWMMENLNYDVPNDTTDVCYRNSADSCAKYGRLYSWATVMAGGTSSSANPSGLQGICPEGWHVPSDAEWEVLVKYVDPNASGNSNNNAGTRLKSSTGWNASSWVPTGGTDEYGFSALPGGRRSSDGSFFNAYGTGGWWTTTERVADIIVADRMARYRSMYYYNEYVYSSGAIKEDGFSLRCLRD